MLTAKEIEDRAREAERRATVAEKPADRATFEAQELEARVNATFSAKTYGHSPAAAKPAPSRPTTHMDPEQQARELAEGAAKYLDEVSPKSPTEPAAAEAAPDQQPPPQSPSAQRQAAHISRLQSWEPDQNNQSILLGARSQVHSSSPIIQGPQCHQ